VGTGGIFKQIAGLDFFQDALNFPVKIEVMLEFQVSYLSEQ
jgi:hypothetical protein